MKIGITILVILLLIVGAFKLWDYWDRVNSEKEETERKADATDLREYDMPGLPYQLEARFNQARAKGASGLKEFLDTYRKAPRFEDPRKAWIELDYVNLIAGSDPVEAKKIFLDVKQRIRTNAPIYRRIRAMSKTFE